MRNKKINSAVIGNENYIPVDSIANISFELYLRLAIYNLIPYVFCRINVIKFFTNFLQKIIKYLISHDSYTYLSDSDCIYYIVTFLYYSILKFY